MNLERLGSIDSGKDGPFAFGTHNQWFARWGRAGGFFGTDALFLHALADAQQIRTITPQKPGGSGSPCSISCLAVDPLASRIAIGWDGVANFALPAWGVNVHIYDFASNRLVAFPALRTRAAGVAGTKVAAFSPSGRMLASSEHSANAVHLVDVDSVLDPKREATPPAELKSKGVLDALGIAWSPDGKLLARASRNLANAPGLEFWRLPNGDDPDHIEAESLGHVAFRVTSKSTFGRYVRIAFSPDGDLVAIGGVKKPKIFLLYSVAQREKLLAESAPLEGEVTTLAFSPDGLHVFSGDDKGTVAAWRLEGSDRSSLAKVDSAVLGQSIVGLDVDRDTQTLCVASASKKTVDLFTTALPG